MSIKDERRMKAAVRAMQAYWLTYDKQTGYEKYSDETFINDALYAIGIALEPDQYRFADGFAAFKDRLIDFVFDPKEVEAVEGFPRIVTKKRGVKPAAPHKD